MELLVVGLERGVCGAVEIAFWLLFRTALVLVETSGMTPHFT